MNRREFAKRALAGSGFLAVPVAAIGEGAADAAPGERAPIPYSTLGRTGVRVSRLGVGCGHFRYPHVTAEVAGEILHRAVERSVNYIDTAPNYGDAEKKMGPAIKEIRDKIFLVTKTEEPSYEGTWRSLRRSLKLLQTDHLDLVHIHSVGNEERFPDLAPVLGDKGALGALREAKKQGVIRYIGASAHKFPSRCHKLLDTGEIDVLMNAVNFIVQHSYDFEHKIWSRARLENVGLVAMKVLGGRNYKEGGFEVPEASYEQAIRYALSVPGVSCAVIGIERVAELDKAATCVSRFQTLSQDEFLALYRRGIEILAGDARWRSPYGSPVT